MAAGKFGVYFSYQASEAITEGYGVVTSGNPGAGDVELVDATFECNGVACHTAASGDWVTVCKFGEVDVEMDDTTAAEGKIACAADAQWDAAGANNGIAILRTGGATGLQKAFFYGNVSLVTPS